MLREKVAKQELDKNVYGNLPGSKSLFKMRYDCNDEALAEAVIGPDCNHAPIDLKAVIGPDCNHAPIDLSLIGKSENYHLYHFTTQGSDAYTQIHIALNEWNSTVRRMNDDGIYNGGAIAPFANMIYYKSLTLGCAIKYCTSPDYNNWFAIACVYGATPKLGEPLYLADSTDKKGCIANDLCQKLVLKNSRCSTRTGLCETYGNKAALTVDCNC
ncbi:unnamed protein product [Strongylus vulgaris]|uniref:SCP domain-containing protein n=1 Tax=Strongylus vulgaris TaxID=40348 RepID=A0A3P7LF47_STRVU|nr:unnamed protein product [Strongylus vulgaris]